MADSAENVSDKPGWPVIRETITDRNFLLFSFSMTLSTCAHLMVAIALSWMTWQLTKSGAWLGYVSGATIIPALIFGPFGGLLADRIGHLQAIRISQTSYIISLTGLGLALITQTVTIEILFTCAIVHGFIGAIFIPTEFAFLRTLANNRRLIATITIFETFKGVGKLFGPILAAYLMTSAREYVVIGAIGAHALCLMGLSRINFSKAYANSNRNTAHSHSPMLNIWNLVKHLWETPLCTLLLILFVATGFQLQGSLALYTDRTGGGPNLLTNFANIISVLTLLVVLPITLWIASRGHFDSISKYMRKLFLILCISIPITAILINLPGSHGNWFIAILALYLVAAQILSTLVQASFLVLLPQAALASGVGIIVLVQGVALFIIGAGAYAFTEFRPQSGWAMATTILLIATLWVIGKWSRSRMHLIDSALAEASRIESENR